MNSVLLDTGAIIAILDRSEKRHAECSALATSLEAPLVTCEAVIAEACYLLRDLDGACKAILKNVERSVFQVPFRLAGRAAHVATLMNKYADTPMDFADACLVDLASTLKCERVFTLDNDFRIYRWGRNRPFRLLPDDILD